jgi:DNA-binding transcriptional LysR family regulator
MQELDLNLLRAAEVLLSEQSVSRAAARLYLSVPATSRLLDRCRRAFGDPLLVRDGRGLVITPRGVALLDELAPLMAAIERAVHTPDFEPAALRSTFVVRANEVVIAAVGAALLDAVRRAAPDVTLRFELETIDDLDALGATVDLAIGSYRDLGPDLHAEQVAVETMVGVLSSSHPLAGARMTIHRFAQPVHVVASRRGRPRGPIDDLLAARGLRRDVAAVVPSFTAAVLMCIGSDFTTVAPQRLARRLAAGADLVTFGLPFDTPPVAVQQVWHRRTDADPAHRWLRAIVREVAPLVP